MNCNVHFFLDWSVPTDIVCETRVPSVGRRLCGFCNFYEISVRIIMHRHIDCTWQTKLKHMEN